MAIYLGDNTKLKININGVNYKLNLHSSIPVTDGIRLISSDGYVLRDYNCLYATTIAPTYLLSFDDYVLTDYNGRYLIIKEEV